MQEVVVLIVFADFSILYLRGPLHLSSVDGFALIFCGGSLDFMGRRLVFILTKP